MDIRRVITGNAPDGSAVIVSDGLAPRSHDFVSIPGMSQTVVWMGSDREDLSAPLPDRTVAASSILPGPGQSTLVIVRFPPGSVFAAPDFDPAAAAAEQMQASPGLAELFEPDAPGKHTTATVDYGIVLEGEIWVELDDGQEARLGVHDVVIHGGARHSWSVRGQEPALVAFVMLGVGG